MLPSSSLPNQFCCIAGVDFIYHYPLYATFVSWVNLILPLLQLLVTFSHLKRTFLFCRQDLSAPSPFDSFTVLVHVVCQAWHMSQHISVSNKLWEYINYYRSCLYFSPQRLSYPSLFSLLSVPNFLNLIC